MEKQKFKTLVHQVCLRSGLQKLKAYYIYGGEEVLGVIGLQKSSHANGYYINVGFIIKALSQNERLRDVDGDIRARIAYKKGDKTTDFFDLGYLDDQQESIVEIALSSYVNEILIPASSIVGLKKLLKSKPVYLYKTTIKAKEYLGLS